MKILDAAYEASITGQRVLTLAQCVKITLRDGRILAFTTHTSDVIFREERDVIYKTHGFVSTAVSQQSTLAISNLNIELLIDDIEIKRVDLEKNNFNDAKVQIFEFNFMLRPYTLEQVDIMLEGNLGEVKRTQSKFDVEFLSKTNNLTQTFTNKVKATCSNHFGDAMCKIDKDLFTTMSSISKVVKQNQFECTGLTVDDNWFNNGTVQNVRTKETLSVKSSYSTESGMVIKTNLDFAEQLKVGDSLRFVKGCQKRFVDCKGFSNAINFNGFPKLPGNDYLSTSRGTGKQ